MIRISSREDESTYFYFENRVFFEYLEKIGLRLRRNKYIRKGRFYYGMYIILPSGKRIDFPYDIYYPRFCSDSSVSAWFISFLLWEIGWDQPIRSIDELEDTTPELIKVLNDAGILNLDWNDYDKWNQYELVEQLHVIDHYDAFLTCALIEHTNCYDYYLGHCKRVTFKNDVLTIESFCDDDSDEDDIESELYIEDDIFGLADELGILERTHYEWKDDHWEEIVRTSRYLS